MSSKLTPSSSGSSYGRDPRSNAYVPVRRPRSEAEAEGAAVLDADCMSIGISQARYQGETCRNNSELENAVSFSQTQKGFLKVVEEALDQMAELSLKCQDGSDADRAQCTAEFSRLQQFISDIGTKQFNGLSLFVDATLRVAGPRTDTDSPGKSITLAASSFGGDVQAVYDPQATTLDSKDEAAAALDNIGRALKGLSQMQARVHKNLQQLSLSSQQASELWQGLSDATRRINSIDLAGNMTQLARYRILGQADTAKRAQANAVPETAMKLLG